MRTTDPPGHLQEGFELAGPPLFAPDGGPAIEPTRQRSPPRPRLCEAGPCQHYHRLEIQVEAQDPGARRVPVHLPVAGMEPHPAGGGVYRAPATFHTAIEHYCYPEVGIEMELGALPVVQCNRWTPIAPGLPERGGARFLRSESGQKYLADVQAWSEAREREMAEAVAAEQQIAAAEDAAEQQANSIADKLMPLYTFRAEIDAYTGRFLGVCPQFPAARWVHATETGAIEGVRRVVRHDLLDLLRRGETPPPPPPAPPSPAGDTTP